MIRIHDSLIIRKLLLCYSKLDMHGRAHDLYASMDEDNQNNTRTLSILFEYWLHKKDLAKGKCQKLLVYFC